MSWVGEGKRGDGVSFLTRHLTSTLHIAIILLMSSELAAQSPQVDTTLACAERRRDMLQRLAEQGMAIAERLTARTVAPEIGAAVVQHALAYAKIARGVRLALILEARLDGRILAYRNGDASALVETVTVSTGPAAREIGLPGRVGADPENDGDHDDAVERDEQDRLPTGGLRACVETICDNLGVEPDWSCWSDEEGFIHDDGRPVTGWPVRTEPSLPSDDVSLALKRLSSPAQPRSGEDRGRHELPKGRPDG